MSHILVTNDFPPKVGGIQAYLWELWRRLDPTTYCVLTADSDPASGEFDARGAEKGIRIERVASPVLVPGPRLVSRVRQLAQSSGAGLVLLDPALPLGAMGPFLGTPYGVILHGAEVAIPARLPLARQALGAVLARSEVAVCAGGYPTAQARVAAGSSMPTVIEIPPGVDTDRFAPPSAPRRRSARARLGLPQSGLLVTSVSRLVPRKGMDVLIDASVHLAPSFPELTVAIAGAGRDRARLERRVRSSGAPVRLLGQVPEEALPDVYAAADVFVMACRSRWGGLEQEGFGIVFLEAAAAGVPQVAGSSGGAAEAVADGETGLVVRDPSDPSALAAALRLLLGDPDLRRKMGRAARRRVEASFGYDLLASRLADALRDMGG